MKKRAFIEWALLLLILTLFRCGAGEEGGGEKTSRVDSLEKKDPLLQEEEKEQKLVRYPNGKKKMTGKYKDGERHGVWSSWYRDGSLQSEMRYKDGKRHGFYKTWYPNGNLRYEGRYHHGERSGEWKFYNKNGELDRTIEFDHTSD